MVPSSHSRLCQQDKTRDRRAQLRHNDRWLATTSASLLTAISLLATLLLATTEAAIEPPDQQFVEGLRQRRLFSLAEDFCQQQLNLPQNKTSGTADWVVELIRVYSDRAVNTAGAARDASWQKAADVASRFEAANPNHPHLPLVQVQAALALLAQGELARMEAEVGSQPEQAMATARATIRAAARSLETIEKHLTDVIPLAARNTRQAEALTAVELSSLQQHVRYQWARALRNQALCYPTGSADRVAALTQAVRMLQQPLQVLPADDSLVARIKIDQAICHRQLGELKIAATTLNSLDTRDQTPAIRLVARAELLRLLLAAGKVNEALPTLAKGRTLDGVTSPELDFAFLEVYLAKWRETGTGTGNNGATEWEQKSVATLEFIEQTHGPYWARRGELLLVGVNLRAGSGNVSILDRAARDLYRKGRLDDAVVAYDKAAQAAEASGDPQQQFALAYRAALIQQQRQLYGEARQRFSKLARSHRSNPLSSNAHLLSIVNLAQNAKADSSLLAEYEAMLSEHLENWPASDSADTARFWLGQLKESQQKWETAARTYSAITSGSEHFPVAVSSSLRCWTKYLEVLNAAGDPVEEAAQLAIRYCEGVLHRQDTKLPARWGALDGECLIGLARIQLRYTPSNLEQLEQLLRVAIADAEDAASWRNAARSLLVLAVLRMPNGQQEAQRLLAEIGDASREQLLELLAGIEKAAVDAPQLATSIGKLERDIADRLLNAAEPLDAAQQMRVAMIRAAALAKLGDDEGALAAYAALAQKHANQATVQVAYAERLLSSQDPARLRLGLTQWRRVASRTKPRTTRWFRAKYSVAMAQFKLGEKEAAAKLIRYLQATEDLASSGLENEFRELLDRCQ